jgi:hypothetical protein
MSLLARRPAVLEGSGVGFRARAWEPEKEINLKIISKFEIFKQHFQTRNDFKFKSHQQRNYTTRQDPQVSF